MQVRPGFGSGGVDNICIVGCIVACVRKVRTNTLPAQSEVWIDDMFRSAARAGALPAALELTGSAISMSQARREKVHPELSTA